MAREQKFTAIILKKQPYREGDEIITLFTKEQGKVRVLAKSVKSAKSKLQQKLQALFLVEIIVTQSTFPKVMGAEPLKVFGRMRENLQAMKMAFYAMELVLKLTADEQKNELLFNLLQKFLEFLDSEENQETLNLGLAKFKIEVLESSGLGIHQPIQTQPDQNIYFSPGKGGFTAEIQSDALRLKSTTFESFLALKAGSFEKLNQHLDIQELQNILSQFIEYQLERKVKSEGFLNMV